MEQPLRQIRNNNQNQIYKSDVDFNLQQLKKNILRKIEEQTQKFPFKKLLIIDTLEIDYGECVPSTVHQRNLILTLTQDLFKPITFTMQIICEDEVLNNLSQFVYAIKKGKQCEFTDLYKFKLHKKGKYDFTIAVKSPNFIDYKVESKLKIFCEFTDMKDQSLFYTINLIQKTFIPIIQCPRQLEYCNNQALHTYSLSNKNVRVLKFSQLRSKPKRQIKIAFTLEENTRLTLICDLLSANQNEFQNGLLQIKPRQVALAGKGQFIMTFKLNFPQHLVQYLQKCEQKANNNQVTSYIIRRVLIMRINQTSFHYHFPIEVSFLLGLKKDQLK